MRYLATLATLLASLGLAAAARAQDVVVQGTTDVRDAGLVDNVLVPGFHRAHPRYTLKYVAVGTGQALTNARAGQGDAVLTHAPPLEAQFVKDGFSQYGPGRAIFYSDYVIVGPKNDPAGVAAKARHDAVKAFELIAKAGAGGRATFVSRGDASGTNVEEQGIWALTKGVQKCAVAKARRQPSTVSGPCPPSPANPTWYKQAGGGQAATVQLANQCPFSGGCYDITDRGTFNRLVGNGSVKDLKIVADKNTPKVRGGKDLLVNSFHAYGVKASKFARGTINTAGAKAFLDYLTSPALQARLASYPNTRNQAFFGDARPGVSVGRLPRRVRIGRRLTLTGTLRNLVPGTPPLSGVRASLLVRSGRAAPRRVSRATTSSTGAFRFRFTARRSGRYIVSTPVLTRTEIVGSPDFRDTLQAQTTTVAALRVTRR